MNGQLKIDGFLLPQEIESCARQLMRTIDNAISLYEEEAEALKGNISETEKTVLLLCMKSGRQHIIEAFDNVLDLLANRDETVEAISKVMKEATRENIDTGVSGIRAFYNALQGYLESVPDESSEVLIAGLPEEMRSEIEEKLKASNDSGNAFINDSPVLKKIMRPQAESKKREDIKLSNREDAIFSVVEGYLDPYEVAILEEIGKFKFLENQITANGKTFCTVGQLYRALRGGGEQSPTVAQRNNIMRELEKLSENDRKIVFKMNEYVKSWGGFEVDGGRLRIVSFDEFTGRIRGQEDTLIVFDNTIILHAIAENLKMYEVIPQEVKAIKERFYTVTLSNGTVIEGNARKIKQLMNQHGASEADIAGEVFDYKKMSLSRPRIAIRTQLLKFIYSYTRARTVSAAHSNKLPYSAIFETCNINSSSRETVKRTIEDVKAMLEHFQTQQIITYWQEYTNRGSRKPDGIEISIAQPVPVLTP